MVGLLVLARGLVLLPILTKNIPLPTYGLWAEITAALGLVLPLASLGLDNAVIRMWPARRERADVASAVSSVLATVALCAAIVAILGFGLAGPLGGLTSDPEGPTLVRLASVSIFVGVVERFVVLFFRAYRRVGVYSAFQLLDAYLSVAVTAVLVLAGRGLVGAITAPLLIQALLAIVGFTIIVREVGIARPRLDLLRSYLGFALPLLPTGIFVWVINASDRFILGALDGPASVGVYAVGYQWATYTTLFFNPIFLVLAPRTAELWDQRRPDEALAVIERSTRAGLLFTIPTIIGATVLGPPLLHIVATPDYVPGAIVIPFVGLGYLLFMLSAMNETVLNLRLRNRPLALIYLTAAVFNLLATYLLVRAFGFLGAALATLLTFAALTAMTAAFARRGPTFRVDGLAVMKQVAAALVMGVVISVLAPTGALGLALAVPTGAGVYFVLLYALRGIDPADVRLVRSVVLRS